MNSSKNPYGWFEEKHYGWGWMPVKWQGWVVTLGYVALIYFGLRQADFESRGASDTLVLFSPWFIGSTILLIAICYKTGGKPRWRWGDHIWK